ncbi:MAG: GntR family transcriptional regulator, partial [Victivallaceae bacterium]
MFEKVLNSSPLPRYYQARKKLETSIIDFYGKGDKLPPEKDLAQQLGVSLITVRKALADMQNDGIIEKQWGKGIYVKETKHIRNAVRKKVALTVILRNDDELGHPALSGIISGLGEVWEQVAVDLELVFITQKMLIKNDYSAIINKKFDGLIASVLEIPEKSLKALKEKIPHVISFNRFDSQPAIIFDYEDSTREIIEYLYRYGHRRIALLAGVPNTVIPERVYSQYKDSLKEFGIPCEEKLVRFGFYTQESGYQLAKEILALEKVSAFIMGDDNMALGALKAITERGLTCPGDISICSFNDLPVATIMKPNLTTVRIPFKDMGKLAGEIMVKLMKGAKLGQIKIKGNLLIRDSAAPCNKTII